MRKIATIRKAPKNQDRKLYALLDLCKRQEPPQDRIAVLRALLHEVDPQNASLESLDVGVLEAVWNLLIDSDSADDALDLALSVVESSVLAGGRGRICWSLACVSDCLARLNFQHEARSSARSALSFLAGAPHDLENELARRINYRLSVQHLRIGRLDASRRHLEQSMEADESLGDGPRTVWAVKLPWLQGLLDSAGADGNSIRSLQLLKTAGDAAFRQRLCLEFCHIALQGIQIALDLRSHDRLRDMIVDSRTKTLVLLADLLRLATVARPDQPCLPHEHAERVSKRDCQMRARTESLLVPTSEVSAPARMAPR